jgi:hypothetical protein
LGEVIRNKYHRRPREGGGPITTSGSISSGLLQQAPCKASDDKGYGSGLALAMLTWPGRLPVLSLPGLTRQSIIFCQDSS